MDRLKQGVSKFQEKSYKSMEKLFRKLADGQSPHTLFITCSDSRIDPNLLTQCQPGELFVIRNAGNLVPPHGSANGGEGATIEYAVAALGVKNIVVCGHSQCGAMQGLLHPEKLETLPAVAQWLSHAEATRRVIREQHSKLKGEKLLAATIRQNVLMQLTNLKTLPSVASRLQKGDLRLLGWVYEFESGNVQACSGPEHEFVALSDSDDAGFLA